MFREELLHHIWRSGSFEVKHLYTRCGKAIVIKNQGKYHHDAGPDFNHAELIINGLHWSGSVEIHIKSSDWYRHQHDKDPNYQNVILHVVWECDVEVFHSDGTEIPVLELKNRVLPAVLERYEVLRQSLHHIPCAGFIRHVDPVLRQQMIVRCGEERITEKAFKCLKDLEHQSPDWDTLLFRMMLRSFGLPVNSEAFEWLAERLPLKGLMKLGELYKVEALILGSAGFLNHKHSDEYAKGLYHEYKYLQKLYPIEPIPVHQWKFLRMRPASFPVFRLAQFAALVCLRPRFFSELYENPDPQVLNGLLDTHTSEYWQTHYRFGISTKYHSTQPGTQLKNNLLINAMAPVLYAYGMYHQNEQVKNNALSLLKKLSPEDNKYIRIWRNFSIEIQDALTTQGLLHLTKNYCFVKQCLSCGIGQKIIDNSHGNQNRGCTSSC